MKIYILDKINDSIDGEIICTYNTYVCIDFLMKLQIMHFYEIDVIYVCVMKHAFIFLEILRRNAKTIQSNEF